MRQSQYLVVTPVCMAALLLTGGSNLAIALPVGGQVTQGAATIGLPAGGKMEIRQTTATAGIDWSSFSISATESLRVVQPSASSVLVNRVTGSDPSQIFGRLDANGRVFLSNPRGILFGAGSVVDVGGLLATTLSISADPNSPSRFALTGSNILPGEIVVAEGSAIRAPGGTVAFAGPQISLNGAIDAQRVAAAAANAVQIDIDGDGLIFFNPRNDENLNAKLSVLGSIKADGGVVDLRAAARAGLAETVLNIDGVVQARSIGVRNGQVFIDGGSAGDTLVTGRIDVSGAGAGETGGRVSVLGNRVGLFDAASIDASGAAGGGTILVGGNWQGGGSERQASDTRVGAAASLDASALGQGSGGTIAVWSTGSTRVDGALQARGGAAGGDGGRVETSGKGALGLVGRVDVGAAQGVAGNWLLDPNDVKISTASVALDGAAPANTFRDDGGAANATVSATSVKNALVAGATVTVQTSGNGAAGTGTITVEADVNPTMAAANATLNLLAHKDVIVSNTIAKVGLGAGVLSLGIYAGAGSGGGTDGAGAVATIGAAGTHPGAVSVNAPIAVPGGTLTVVSGGTITQTSPITAAAASFNAGANSITLLDAGNDFTGPVTLTSSGAAVSIRDSKALTLAAPGLNAATSLTAIAGSTLALPVATNLVASGFDLRSNGGSLITTGTLTAANGGITLVGSSGLTVGHTLSASGTGVISLTGGGGGLTVGGGIAVTAVSGDVTINGGGGAIELNNSTVSTSATGATALRIRNATTVKLGNLSAIGGSSTTTLGVGGDITSAVTQNTGTTIAVATLAGNVTSAVTLTNANNTVNNLGLFAASNGLSLATVGAVTVTDVVTVSAGTLGIQATGGNVTINAGGQLNSSGSIVLRTITSGDIGLLGSANANTAMTLASAGGILQTGGGVVAGVLTGSAAGQVDLNQANNVVGNLGAFTSTGGFTLANLGNLSVTGAVADSSAAVTLGTTAGTLQVSGGGSVTGVGVNLTTTTSGNIVLGDNVTAGAGTATLTSAGNISQSGGSINADTLTGSAASTVVLGQANTLAKLGAFTSTGGFGLTDVGGLSVTGAVADSTGLASITTSGTLAIGSGSSVSGVGATLLTTAGGNITLAGNLDARTGTATLSSAGLVNQTAGAVNAATLTGSAAGVVNLPLVNTVSALGAFGSNGGFTLLNAKASLGINGAVGDAGGDTSINNSGNIALGANVGNVATNTTLTANGGQISRTAGVVSGVDVSLSGQNGVAAHTTATNLSAQSASGGVAVVETDGVTIKQIGSLVNGANTGGYSVTVAGAGGAIALAGDISTTTASNLLLQATGGISQSAGRLLAGGTTTLAGGAGAIGVNQLTNNFDNGLILSNSGANAVAVSATSNIALVSANVGDSLSVTAKSLANAAGTGNISQTGALIVPGTSTFTIDTGLGRNVLLATGSNNFGGAVTFALLNNGTINDIALRNVNPSAGITALNLPVQASLLHDLTLDYTASPMALPALTLSGGLHAQASGDVTQTGAISTGSASTVTSNTGLVNLSTTTNDFVGVLTASAPTAGKRVSVADANSLAVALNTLGSGSVTAVAALTVSGSTGTALDTHSGTTTSFGATTVGGTLGALSGGNISQTGALTVTGATTLTSTTGLIDVTLSNAANDFSTASLQTSGGGRLGVVTLRDSTALTVGGAGTTAADALVSVTAGGAVILSGGEYRSLAVTAVGDITQSSLVSTVLASSVSSSAGLIDLSLAGNDFGGPLTAAAATVGKNVSVADANSLDLVLNAGNIGSATAAGTLAVAGSAVNALNLTAGGTISQTGALSLGNANGVVTITAATNPIAVNLASAPSNALKTVSLLATGGGKFTTVNIADAGAVVLGGAGTTTADTDLTLTAADTATLSGGGYKSMAVTAKSDISESGALTVLGSSSFTINTTAVGQPKNVLLGSADNDFTGAVNFAVANNGVIRDIALRNVHTSPSAAVPTLPMGLRNLDLAFPFSAVALPAVALTGNLGLVAGGNVTQTGVVTVAGATTITSAAGPISVNLGSAPSNDFNTVSLLKTGAGSFGSVVLTDASALTVGGTGTTAADTGLTVTAAGVTTLSGGSYQSLLLNAGGNVNQSGAVNVAAGTTLTATTGLIVVNLATPANDFNTVRLLTTGLGRLGALTVADANAIAIGGAGTSAADSDLTLTSGGAATLTGGAYRALAVTAAADITQTGVLSTAQASGLSSTGGLIDVSTPANDFTGLLTASATAANKRISVADVNSLALALTAGGTGTATAGTALAVSGSTGSTLTTSSGSTTSFGTTTVGTALSATAGGDVTQTGSVTTGAPSSLITSTGSITLATPVNNFVGLLTATAATPGKGVTVADANDLSVALTAGGAGSATAGTALAVSGSTGSTLTTSSGSTTNFGTTTVGTALSATAGGDVTQTGSVTTGAPSSLITSTGSITLATPANNFLGLLTATAATSGKGVTVADANDLSVALTAGGAGSATAGTALAVSGSTGSTLTTSSGSTTNFGTTTVGTALSATAGGDVTQTGSVTTGAPSSVTSTTGAITLATPANNFLGLLTATAATSGKGVTVADANDLSVALTAGGAGNATAAAALAVSGSTGSTLTTSSGSTTNFGTTTVGTALSATAGGDVTQTGSVTTGAPSSVITSTGSITLATPANNFLGLLTATAATLGKGVTVADANDLSVALTAGGAGSATAGTALAVSGSTGSTLTTSSGSTTNFGTTTVGTALSATAGGDVTQTGSVTTGAPSSVTSTTGAITLATPANNFLGLLTATAATSGKGVTVADANDLSVALTAGGAGSATAATALTVSGSTGTTLVTTSGTTTSFGATTVGTALTVTADGDVTQTGSVTTGAPSSVITSTGSITLATPVNNFVGLLTATAATPGKGVTVADANDLSVALTAGGAGSATAGAALTVSGSTGTTLATTSGTTTSFGATTVGTDLSVSSAAAVTQSAAITALGLELQGAGAVTLTNAANHFSTLAAGPGLGKLSIVDADGFMVGSVNATPGITRSGDVSLRNETGDMALNQPVSLGGATLSLSSTGVVTQSAPITVAGLELLGNAAFTLVNTGNSVAQFAAGAGSGAIALNDSTALNIGTVNTTVGVQRSGSVSLSSPAAVTQDSGSDISANGLLLAGDGWFTLNNVGNKVAVLAAGAGKGALAYTDADALMVGTVAGVAGITRSGAVSLGTVTGDLGLVGPVNIASNPLNLSAAAGSVSQTPTAGAITAGAVAVDAANDVSLGGPNVISSLVANAKGGDLLIKSEAAYVLGALSAPGKTITLDIGSGTLTQQASTQLNAANLLLRGDGVFDLTAATNAVDNIAAAGGLGSLAFVDAKALTVTTVGSTAGINRSAAVSLQTLSGDLNLAAGLTAPTITLTSDKGAISQIGSDGKPLAADTRQALAVGDPTTSVIAAADLKATAARYINLGGSNALTGTLSGAAKNGDLRFKNGNGYSLGSVSAVGNTVTLDTASGTVQQSDTSSLTATNLLLKGSGAYTLEKGSNQISNFAATAGEAATGDGVISVVNQGEFNVTAVSATNGGASVTVDGVTRTGGTGKVTLSNSAGKIEFTPAPLLQMQGGTINVAAPVVTNGSISSPVFTLTGDIKINRGSVSLTATPGAKVDTSLTDRGVDDASDKSYLKYVGIGRTVKLVDSLGKTIQILADVFVQTTGSLTVAADAGLSLQAPNGGSAQLLSTTNDFQGAFEASLHSGVVPAANATAGVDRALLRVGGKTVTIGTAGVQADIINIRADQLLTRATPDTVKAGTAVGIVARMGYKNSTGTGTQMPALLLDLGRTSFDSNSAPFGALKGNSIAVSVGTGDQPGDAGFVSVRPIATVSAVSNRTPVEVGSLVSKGAAIVLSGPETGVAGYLFFYDGAGIQAEIPVYYNGYAPSSPQVEGALSSIASISEAARRDRFEETVRTENVASRLRAGVITEVGPGRPATAGSDGAAGPDDCTPKSGNLTCLAEEDASTRSGASVDGKLRKGAISEVGKTGSGIKPSALPPTPR